jgi:hypothetical protein
LILLQVFYFDVCEVVSLALLIRFVVFPWFQFKIYAIEWFMI